MPRLLLLTLVALNCCQLYAQADLVIRNAIVYTVNSRQPDAEAVAVKGGRIVFVGSNGGADAFTGSATQVIDARGAFVMPGIMEGHGHIHNLGDFLRNLNLMNVSGYNEIVRMVKEAVSKAQPGEWIIGRGWHQEKWSEPLAEQFLGYPYHDALSAVSPNNPVLLTHASGHSVYVNQKAMDMAGITASTPNPAGGDIVKDKQGRLLGVLEETAMRGVWAANERDMQNLPLATRFNQWAAGIALAEEDCLKKGITSFVDAGSSLQLYNWMKQLNEKQALQLRHWVMIPAGHSQLRDAAEVFPYKPKNAATNKLYMNAIKVSLDGALGSYGAWLLEPYSDRQNFIGQNTFPMDSLRAIAAFAWSKRVQLCVHAIGDKANRETVNIFAAQIAKDKKRDHRWRIEHAQHVHPSEIPRFAQHKIVASMQGIHCTSDAPFVPKRLGEERSRTGAYMWKAFLQQGVLVNNGTDVPVEDADPFANIYATVTRKMANGEAFYPAQALTRKEALYSYTMANAKAQFQEKELGSLEPGKLADITILDTNLLTCHEDDIRKTQVLYTIIGGKILYKKVDRP